MKRFLEILLTIILGPLLLGLFVFLIANRPDLLPLAIIALLLLMFLSLSWTVARNVTRHKRYGWSIISPCPAAARFSECYISGMSHKRFMFSRVPSGRRLWVAVTDDRLMVGFAFPFNLILPERFSIEYNLPATDILETTVKKSSLGTEYVNLRFRLENGREYDMNLGIRRRAAFLAAVKASIEPPVEAVLIEDAHASE